MPQSDAVTSCPTCGTPVRAVSDGGFPKACVYHYEPLWREQVSELQAHWADSRRDNATIIANLSRIEADRIMLKAKVTTLTAQRDALLGTGNRMADYYEQCHDHNGEILHDWREAAEGGAHAAD